MTAHKNSNSDLFYGEVDEIVIESTEELTNVQAVIQEMVSSSNLFLFMKGNSDKPKCGFSANAVAVLNQLGVNYSTFDVVQNKLIADGIKEYSGYDSFPQVFINGRFIGDSQKLFDLYQSGQLRSLIAA